ncbi:unnamed protein product, partial [Prorocentrum cordatum]
MLGHWYLLGLRFLVLAGTIVICGWIFTALVRTLWATTKFFQALRMTVLLIWVLAPCFMNLVLTLVAFSFVTMLVVVSWMLLALFSALVAWLVSRATSLHFKLGWCGAIACLKLSTSVPPPYTRRVASSLGMLMLLQFLQRYGVHELPGAVRLAFRLYSIHAQLLRPSTLNLHGSTYDAAAHVGGHPSALAAGSFDGTDDRLVGFDGSADYLDSTNYKLGPGAPAAASALPANGPGLQRSATEGADRQRAHCEQALRRCRGELAGLELAGAEAGELRGELEESRHAELRLREQLRAARDERARERQRLERQLERLRARCQELEHSEAAAEAQRALAGRECRSAGEALQQCRQQLERRTREAEEARSRLGAAEGQCQRLAAEQQATEEQEAAGRRRGEELEEQLLGRRQAAQTAERWGQELARRLEAQEQASGSPRALEQRCLALQAEAEALEQEKRWLVADRARLQQQLDVAAWELPARSADQGRRLRLEELQRHELAERAGELSARLEEASCRHEEQLRQLERTIHEAHEREGELGRELQRTRAARVEAEPLLAWWADDSRGEERAFPGAGSLSLRLPAGVARDSGRRSASGSPAQATVPVESACDDSAAPQ